MKNKLYLIIFFLLPGISFGQKLINISGWVEEAGSGERLIGATIQDMEGKTGVITDNFGVFILPVSPGLQQIRIIYAGYEGDTLSFFISLDTIVRLQLRAQRLREVVISATRADQNIGLVNIPIAELKSRPALLGEADIMKALSLTPGVRTGTEGTAGLYVRGGTPDQNYILLDGAVVYNTSHLFGLLSVFNPDAIKSVSLYKGGMPARFGGRLSSVIDITMKEGDAQKRRTEASIGLISSHFTTEGPIRKGRSSYLLSGRAAYLGLFLAPSRAAFNSGRRNEFSNFWMYDLNGKVNFEINEKSRFYASFYTGHDTWINLSRINDERFDFGLKWGNRTATLRYTNLLNNGGFFISQVAFTQYKYAVEQASFDTPTSKDPISTLNSSLVQDATWKNTFQFAPARKHKVEVGAEISTQSLQPQRVQFTGIKVEDDSALLVQARKYRGIIAFVFIEDQLSIGRFHASIGLRSGWFGTGGKGYVLTEPRLGMAYNFNKHTALQVSWRYNNQFIHLLSTSSVGLPNEIWVPATATAPPSAAMQWSGGITTRIDRWKTVFTAEIYHKTMQNLLDFRQGSNFIIDGRLWEDIVTKNGIGRAYGFELMARRTAGKLSGWAAYTWSKNERRFADIDRGKWFPHRFDRRHEVSLTGSYALSKKWQLAGTFVFSTGNAFTGPTHFYVTNDFPVYPTVEPFFASKNNLRMPNYHRLDITATKSYETKRKREASWSFGVYNVYARANPFYVDISTGSLPDGFNTPRTSFYTLYRTGALFTFIPSVNYAIKFR